MLKLTSNRGGKFDIVFEHSPDFDESAKLSGNRATSAGRRKNIEWKSKILPKKNPKEPQFKKVKTSKTTQLRKSTIAKKYDRKGKDDKPKPAPIPEDTITHEVSTATEIKGQEKIEIYDTENHDDVQNNSAIPKDSVKQIERRSTYTFDGNDGAGIISNELLHQLQKELMNDEKIVEPNRVPGLQIDTTPNKSKGSIDKSPNSTQNTLRENEIRKRQSTPVQLYDPWGKPGAGAPISTSDGSIRTHRNVKMLQSEKERDRRARSPEKSPREEESSQQTENPPEISYGKPSVHARGKGKQLHELSDLEKKKAKHFEHQQAIAAQVEEKRMQKQLEKERKLKEEQEAEERYQKQQELIQKRLDDERQKEKEKQEAKLKKQMMLEENIRRAQEEAQRAKDEARKARMQKAQPPESPKAPQPRFKRVLHGENDTIRSSQNYEDNTVLEEFTKLYNDSPPPRENSPQTFNNSPKNEETYRMLQPKKNPTGKNPKKEKHILRPTAEEKQSQIMGDYLVPFRRTETAEMYDQSHPEGDVNTDSFNIYDEQRTEHKKQNAFEDVVPNNVDTEHHHDKARTKKKTKKAKSKSPLPIKIISSRPTSWLQNRNNSPDPVASPSTKRQQEILDRLAELRAGLKQKERECHETTWSR